MKKSMLLFCVLILFVKQTYSQIKNLISTEINPIRYVQGFVYESLSGYGFPNSTINSLTNIGSSNPAIAADYSRISIGVSEQLDTKINSVSYIDISHKRDKPFLPQSAGIVIPIRKLRVGLGFSQKYNAFVDYGELTGTRVDPSSPSGYVDTGKIRAFNRIHVIGYSLMSSGSILNHSGTVLHSGVRLEIDQLTYQSTIAQNELIAKDFAFGWSAGFRFDIKMDSSWSLKFGMFVDKGTHFDAFAYDSGYRPSVTLETSEDTISASESVRWHIVQKMPTQLHAGLFAGSERSLFVLFDIRKIFLNQAIDGFHNSTEFSASLTAKPNKRIAASIGFLSTDRRELYWDPYYSLNGYESVLFFTCGLMLHFKQLDTEMAFASSRNDETFQWYRQNLFKCASHLYF
jgi:hypothetical protein